jgi:ATP-dependent helicase Lhr and Lhr-like helicase
MNASEMARRRFREIARVAGLVFSGYPGKSKTSRQVQVSSGLLFDVFSEYDPENLLLHQAEREVLEQQLEESRLRNAMKRLSQSRLISVELERASPMALPLLVESWRGKVSSETIAERVSRMQLALAKKPSKSGTKRGGVSRVGASREGASRGGASRGSASRGGASRGGALHAPLRNPDKITTPGTNNKANS